MKKLIVAGTIAGAMFAGVAQAGDFSGPYVGGSLGFNSYSADYNDLNDYYDNQGLNGNSDLDFNMGLHGGMNFQQDSFVYGVEVGYTQYDSQSKGRPWNQAELTSDLDSALTVRLRAGVATGDNLVYVAAGPSWNETSFKATDFGLVAKNDDSTLGLSLAAGVEHQLGNNLTTRLQAEYTTFQTTSVTTAVWGGADSFSHDDQLFSVTAGISYNF